MTDLRKISGLKNLSKVMEKVIAEFLLEDIKPSRDTAQHGNEKGVSVLHYLIRMQVYVMYLVMRATQLSVIL